MRPWPDRVEFFRVYWFTLALQHIFFLETWIHYFSVFRYFSKKCHFFPQRRGGFLKTTLYTRQSGGEALTAKSYPSNKQLTPQHLMFTVFLKSVTGPYFGCPYLFHQRSHPRRNSHIKRSRAKFRMGNYTKTALRV